MPGSLEMLSTYMDYTSKELIFQKPKNREEDNIDHRQSTEGRILCLCVKKVVGEESC